MKKIRALLRALHSTLRGAIAFYAAETAKVETNALRLLYRSQIQTMTARRTLWTTRARRREARLWVDGQAAFQRIVRSINGAREEILIRIFIWKDDETGRMIRDALVRAAHRGVTVEIAKEASGDFFEVSQPFLETRGSTDPAWQAFWRHPNIRILHQAGRDHAKVYIIDKELVLLTGMNIADEYRQQWHDYLVELRGSRYALDIIGHARNDANSSICIMTNDSRAFTIRSTIERALMEAKKSICIEHCYFTDTRIIDIVARRATEGIRTTVITPATHDVSHHASLLALDRLQKKEGGNRIKILEYPSMFHAKVILIDGWTCIMGSANLNPLSLDRTGEVCVMLRGKISAVRKMRRALRRDIVRSKSKTKRPIRLLSRMLAAIGL